MSAAKEGATTADSRQIDKILKIADFVIHDEKYFDLPLGYREESTRGPWQTSRKHYSAAKGSQASTVVVGGLNAAMRLKKDSIIQIEPQSKESTEIPPDVVVDPVTMQTIAVPHKRKKPFEHNVQVESGASAKTAIPAPRIVELDARINRVRSESISCRDGMFHASSGWLWILIIETKILQSGSLHQCRLELHTTLLYDAQKSQLNPKYGQ